MVFETRILFGCTKQYKVSYWPLDSPIKLLEAAFKATKT
jgi:hypothetical protein